MLAPKSAASGSDAANAAQRTHRRRQTATTRIFRRALLDRLDRDNPVASHVEWKRFVQPLDERRSVLVEERHESDGPLLGVAVGEGEGARVHELAPQRLVAALGRLN